MLRAQSQEINRQRLAARILQALCCLWIICFTHAAQGTDIANIAEIEHNRIQLHIVIPRRTAQIDTIVASFRQQLPGNPIHIVDISENQNIVAGTSDLVIGIGPKSTQYSLQRLPDHTRFLSLFTSSLVVQNLQRTAKAGIRMSAIYTDPNPIQQIGLARNLLNREIKVGLIVSPDAVFIKRYIEEKARDIEGVDVQIFDYDPSKDIGTVSRFYNHIDVILAYPDPKVFNKHNTRYLLLSAFRSGIPVIGFSKGLVKSGALAAIFPDVDDSIDAAIIMVKQLNDGGPLPKPAFSESHKITLNKRIALSLNIPISTDILKQSEAE